MVWLMSWPGTKVAPIFLSCLSLIFLASNSVFAGGGPKNVCVVRNIRSLESTQICNYYVQARGIPPENICTISCSTAEIISRTEYDSYILPTIRNFLQKPELANRIDYIVLTKGVPLGVNYGFTTGPLSMASMLTCASETGITGPITNPYGPTANPVVEEAFSHQKPYGGRYLYLVSRLDGYTVQDVYSLINRSLQAAPGGVIALDRCVTTVPSYAAVNDRLTAARNVLQSKGFPTIFDDSSIFLSNLTGLMGYFSWGSNDTSFSLSKYRSNMFIPGGIADTFVSSSARTFAAPQTTGQSLIADLIACGASGLGGFVSEPYTAYTTYPQVLFDRYTKGYNLAESFYAATPKLFWKFVLVGDPLMAPFAEKPYVSIDIPQEPLTGVATLSAAASDPNGIAKVEFYFDGKLVGTDTTPPYTAYVDTTQYVVGKHTVEAIAYQNTAQKTQGLASAQVEVWNPISNLSVVSDAFASVDGQGVRATEKVVVASTSDMGGGEFYIQEENRTSGIRVVCQGNVNEGDVVTVVGDLVTESGERTILASYVEVVNSLLTPLAPLYMPNKYIGGGNYSSETPGVTNGIGLRNLGLLIKTTGTVTHSSENENFFYISDGSLGDDGTGHIGIKVKSRFLEKPPVGAKVAVTGISSCEVVGDITIRVLKVRKQSDIQIIAL